MDAERVRIEIVGQVADVRLTRADKHNGIDWRMFAALNEALDQLHGATGVRAVTISGDGPSFCAGLDFKSFASANGEAAGDGFAPVDGSEANFAQRVAHGWRELEVPVIAALRGACFGGGLQIALGADVRFAAPDTRLSVMEIRYGLVPDMSLWQASGLVRDDVLRELAYTGRVVEAPEARELGLVTAIADEPLTAASELATTIAERSPDAIRRIKRLASQAPRLPAKQGLALEAQLQRELLGSPNQLAAVAATLGGSPARFVDPSGVGESG